jgi:hypothetical protein
MSKTKYWLFTERIYAGANDMLDVKYITALQRHPEKVWRDIYSLTDDAELEWESTDGNLYTLLSTQEITKKEFELLKRLGIDEWSDL